MRNREDICRDRLKRVFAKSKGFGKYTHDYFLSRLPIYSNCTLEVSCGIEKVLLSGFIEETELLIGLLNEFYDIVISGENRGSVISLAKVLLMRGFIQDIKAYKLLMQQGLELQALQQGRVILERQLVLILVITDEEYCKELVINSKNKNSNERFYKLLRPKAIWNRLAKGDSKFFRIYGKGRWQEMYSLFSALGHNDLIEWLKNYDEGGCFRIDLTDNASPWCLEYCSFLNQNIITYLAPLFLHFPIPAHIDKRKVGDMVYFLLAYWDEVIEDSYLE